MPEILHENSNRSTIVMAIGVGGGGGNAVNHLYQYGEKEITYMLCNTDRQALENSPIPPQFKVQLGKDGLGAGNEASSGAKLAEESVENVKNVLQSSGIRMAFVVAGMGGGTGTGAAPVIAKTARELGILTIGIVTIPFEEEGKHRIEQAIAGVDALSKNVDSLIIINNTNIVEMFGDLSMREAYYQSNEIIAKAVKSISDIINKHFIVNVDFADVCKVMRNSGVALMGTGIAQGPSRAIEATEQALTSPLLHNQDITGAKNVLVCLISSQENEIRMSDVKNVPAYIQQRTRTGNETDVIWGAGYDDNLGDKMQVIVIATGFNVENIPAMKAYYARTLAAGEKSHDEKQTGQPDEGHVIQLDEDENPVKTKQLTLDDEQHSVRVFKSVSPQNIPEEDEPFIVTSSVSDCVTESNQQKVIVLEEDDNPITEEPVGGYETNYPEDEEPEEDPEDEPEKPKKRKRGIVNTVAEFFHGALVDDDDRH